MALGIWDIGEARAALRKAGMQQGVKRGHKMVRKLTAVRFAHAATDSACLG